MAKKDGQFCPLLGKNCVTHKCAWYTQVQGTNPQTGQEINEWACAVNWLPMLLIENSQQQRQTGAATESFRNEMVKATQANQNTLMAAAKIFSGQPQQPLLNNQKDS